MTATVLRAAVFASASVAMGCTAAADEASAESTRATSQAIVSGATDSGDLAVVLLLAYAPGADPFLGSPSYKSCTATVVSPHVLVTAAHCVGGGFPGGGAGYTYWVYGGTSVTSDPSPKLLAVKSVAYHAQYAQSTNDVGVAVLAAPFAAAAPVAMNRTAIDASHVGRPVRIVGYGATDNSIARTGGGTRRQGTTSLKASLAAKLDFPGGVPQACSGDSGGPNFMTIAGKEVLVGITTAGHDAYCTAGFISMRMDVFASFVDPYIAANDPPPPGGGGGGGGSGGDPLAGPDPITYEPEGTATRPSLPGRTSPPSVPGVSAAATHDEAASDHEAASGCSASPVGARGTSAAALLTALALLLARRKTRTTSRS